MHITYLQNHFRLYTAQTFDQSDTTIQLKKHPKTTLIQNLVIQEYLSNYLDELQKNVYRTKDRTTVGSLFTKTFSRLPLAAFVSMSAFDKKMVFSLAKCYLISQYEGENWVPLFRLEDVEWEPRPITGTDSWRDDAINKVFSELIDPILTKVAQLTNAPRRMLWDNFAVVLKDSYQNKLPNPMNKQAFEDFRYIFEEVIPHISGIKIKPKRTSCCLAHNIRRTNATIREKLEEAKKDTAVKIFCRDCPLTRKKEEKIKESPI
ncbi:hypothetical protein SAMN05444392_1101 [Seinonella peptonophila]|uniref:Ferric iron reductase protein FhuF, involved in iron transport n=1 Tax=Seinonella peptonophila TaxID=112248 RepID=A0A1M4ZMD0_9BACL|nr:hypothetical protein [Seinonella peptonophila]SHF19158.1 hypothetical protein SAMN05444392_1101 [Seinonella peptonophila]